MTIHKYVWYDKPRLGFRWNNDLWPNPDRIFTECPNCDSKEWKYKYRFSVRWNYIAFDKILVCSRCGPDAAIAAGSMILSWIRAFYIEGKEKPVPPTGETLLKIAALLLATYLAWRIGISIYETLTMPYVEPPVPPSTVYQK